MVQVGAPDWGLFAGQVSGDYASWDRVVYRTGILDAFRYQISTGIREKLPRPAGKVQYSPAVATDGTTFYVRSDPSAGDGLC